MVIRETGRHDQQAAAEKVGAPYGTGSSAPPGSAAEALAPLLDLLMGPGARVRIDFWDGSRLEHQDAVGTLSVHSPDALRRIAWAPGELGVSRAFVAGDLSIEGDVFEVLVALRDASPARLRGFDGRALAATLRAAVRVGAIGAPLPPPPEECRPSGRIHSPRRDARAISHHYDVGNDFYELVLGSSWTYSCARFVTPATTLDEAQAAKHELVCRKLGLDDRPGSRLLDVGCGWGSMAIHAALHHGATVVGVALSHEQVDRARERVREAGLEDAVEIRYQDYRDLHGEQFDAISSIGMFEHVGTARTLEYFTTLRRLLAPTGRLLNHAISSPGGSRLGSRTFIGRYVFPDGELIDVGKVVLAMERAGFEMRDVESLREHYSRTLHCWVANLEAHWDEAVKLVGRARAEIWRLYMAGSAIGFDDGGIAVHQVLGVVPDADGSSGMPRTRNDWD
ncbi:MAG: cyclopropane-fatty-acyl-phospholipid synthase family protein [Acidimicrobiales bacterium]|jgi:cyclopropane-fatty-acyl-phospholipid synthase